MQDFSMLIGIGAMVLFAVAIGVGFEIIRWWIAQRRRSREFIDARFEVKTTTPVVLLEPSGSETQQQSE